jgi:Na+/melibiose symporter-like transporter
VKTTFDEISYTEVLKNRRAVFALLSILFSMNLFTMVDTILADNLTYEFGLNDSIVSVVFASQCFGFLITSPFAHKVIDKFDCVPIMLCAELV